MSPIKWSPDMSLGNRELNAQHKELIALCREIEESVRQREPRPVVDWLLRQLVAYTRYHCASEEDLMERRGEPDLALHRQDHLDLLERVEQIRLHYRQNGKGISSQTLDELHQWYQDHIMKSTSCAVLA